MHLILVQLGKEDQNKIVYNLTKLCHMLLKVEPQKTKTTIMPQVSNLLTQCHQNPRCLKCGQVHLIYFCQKSRCTAANCANSGKLHSDNYRSCSFTPQTRQTQQPKVRTRPKTIRKTYTFPRRKELRQSCNQIQQKNNNQRSRSRLFQTQKSWTRIKTN